MKIIYVIAMLILFVGCTDDTLPEDFLRSREEPEIVLPDAFRAGRETSEEATPAPEPTPTPTNDTSNASANDPTNTPATEFTPAPTPEPTPTPAPPPEILAARETPPEDILVITERFFHERFMDIYYNTERYLGMVIQYEGIFEAIQTGHETLYFAFRYGPSCCGTHIVGLELFLHGIEPYPDDTWVEVTGILVEFEYWGQTFPALYLISMREMPRGAEIIEGEGFWS